MREVFADAGRGTTTSRDAPERWIARPLPARALALMRVTVCGALTATVAARALPTLRLADAGVGWEPVGVVSWVGSAPSSTIVGLVFAAAAVSGVAATTGCRWRVTGPVFAATALVATTLATSWGQVFHTDNLAVLHVMTIALSPAADEWSIDSRHEPRDSARSSSRHGFPIRIAALVTAATYVLAGWAKLRIGGLDWLDGESLRGLVAHDNLRKELIGAPSTPLAGPVVRQAWLFGPMAVITVVIELGAPLALLGRRWAAWWCAAGWVFHVGIVAVMTVTFWYPLSTLAFVPTLLAAGALPGRVGARVR